MGGRHSEHRTPTVTGVRFGVAGGLTRHRDLEATGAVVFDTMAQLQTMLLSTT